MIDPTRNHFELFGLPQRYRYDGAALERAYRALQSEVHPDRVAGGSEQQKRVALQSSAHVNEAFRALKDPVARASYLLRLHGVDALDETDTALPRPFLERQLERREVAEDAVAARDVRGLSSLVDEIRAEVVDREALLVHMLDDEHAYAAARTAVRELQFLTKLAADVGTLQAALDD
jgi:molecular chaperone HscB